MSRPLKIDRLEILATMQKYPKAFGRPFSYKAAVAVTWGLFTAVLSYALITFDVTPVRIWQGLGRLGWVLGFMFPPVIFDTWQEWSEPLLAIFETVAMAVWGTTLATAASLSLGFLGAKNVFSFPALHFGVRRGFDFLRALEQLILALIFIRAVGLGPLAGILAIAVSDTGSLSKLYAEAIENVSSEPVEGLKASGASKLQIMRLAIIPQVLPVMISTSLYFLESNTRTATILGIVGAGGIGFLLDERIRANNWDEVMTIIIMILFTVALIDNLSRFLRRKVLGRR